VCGGVGPVNVKGGSVGWTRAVTMMRGGGCPVNVKLLMM